MPPLSVVIITYNEERNIGRCLESVKGIADEIVVVDSLSTDRTQEICRTYGARVVEHPFEGHIAQKNYAISQAEYPHQLSLDADEALSEELRREIIRIKHHWQQAGYTMNRLSNYCGRWIRHSGWYPDTKLRLYDSRKGQWTGLDPHDRFELHEGETAHLNGDLLHYTYYTIEQHILQANKFSTIAANALIKSGKRATLLQVLIKPAAKFIRNYVINLGFMDGAYGFTICRITAFETFLKYFKAWHIRRSAGEE
ncbi:MAG: glycosyltransferase family 2 protein [Bacteroidales bacterium]